MPDPYDPNSEGTDAEKGVAAHWECLRRNEDFRALSARWLQSVKFRLSHALSQAYHDPQNHTPRCAWDWMLTAAQRISLAKFQIEKLLWFFDRAFNFGPITCRENFSSSRLTKENLCEYFQIEALAN